MVVKWLSNLGSRASTVEIHRTTKAESGSRWASSRVTIVGHMLVWVVWPRSLWPCLRYAHHRGILSANGTSVSCSIRVLRRKPSQHQVASQNRPSKREITNHMITLSTGGERVGSTSATQGTSDLSRAHGLGTKVHVMHA